MRKFIFNLLIPFITDTLVVVIPSMWSNILNNNYHVYDTHYDSLWEYFIGVIRNSGYPESIFLYTISILVPFQLIKDFFYKIKNNKLSLFLKCIILSILTVIFYTFIISLYTTEIPLSTLIQFIALGLINAILLFVFVDRYTEK